MLLFGFFAECKSEGFVILQEKSEPRFALWTCCVECMEIWQKIKPLVILLVLRDQRGWVRSWA